MTGSLVGLSFGCAYNDRCPERTSERGNGR